MMYNGHCPLGGRQNGNDVIDRYPDSDFIWWLTGIFVFASSGHSTFTQHFYRLMNFAVSHLEKSLVNFSLEITV